MKIGLITLYRYNYGSVLQCFSTQRYLQDNYAECILIEKYNKSKIHSYLKTLVSLCCKCLMYPRSIRSILSQFKAQRSGSLRMSPNSLREIDRFVFCNINKKKYSYNELRSIAATDEYDYFFTGSDQVWNGSSILGQDMYFLRFAPQEKRIAWAPSFGGADISIYNRRSYSKYITQFQSLSAREKSGQKNIEHFVKKKVDVLCDPVILITNEQWRALYNCNTSLDVREKYICLFFIDQISEEALEFTKRLVKNTKLKIISFGYHYESYEKLENYAHYDGSPFEFLKCIDNAEIVVTDSFHAIVFSILFHTEFYSFARNYTHGQDQSTRITDLLININMRERFNPSDILSAIDFDIADAFFQKERIKMDTYLERVLGKKKSSNDTGVVLYDQEADCCGCGACADICPQRAITMLQTDRGFLPVIDYDKCIGCKKCHKVCGLKGIRRNRSIEKKAYIGKGKDSDIVKGTASGGIFASIAYSFLKEDGVVYGASLFVVDGICDCRHIRIDNVKNLHLIVNSKYVQSKTEGVYRTIKNDLRQGKKVLFAGTSCQVASLLTYLEEDEKTNLFTIDLICHGVPSINMLQDYVDYVQKEKSAKILSIQFRNKKKDISSYAPYIMTFELEDKNGKRIEYIPLRNSSYYRLYMSMAGYRHSCYKCRFASISKPADITLGDYYLSESKYQIADRMKIDKNDNYSCIICHSKKGDFLLSSSNIELYEVSINQAILDHGHLQYASMPTQKGDKLYDIYLKNGFVGLQQYIDRNNKIIDYSKQIERLLVRKLRWRKVNEKKR